MSLGLPRSIWDTLTPGTDILWTGIEQTMKALKYHIVLKKDPEEGVYIVSVPSRLPYFWKVDRRSYRDGKRGD